MRDPADFAGAHLEDAINIGLCHLGRTLLDQQKPIVIIADLGREEEAAMRLLLDVRDPADFAGAHLEDAINIGLGGTYATWAGTLLDQQKPIVIIADLGREEEAAMRLGRIGFDHVGGYLESGMLALEERPDLIRQTVRITATTLAEQLRSSEPPAVLDVRGEQEWQDKRIEGSINIPVNELQERIGEVPTTQRVMVYCVSGYRSSIAASLLAIYERENHTDLIGGIAAWEAAKLPTVRREEERT